MIISRDNLIAILIAEGVHWLVGGVDQDPPLLLKFLQTDYLRSRDKTEMLHQRLLKVSNFGQIALAAKRKIF